MENVENNQSVKNQGVEIPEESKSPNDFKINWATVVVSVLFSLVFTLSSLAVYTKFITPKFYTIKVDEILADHIRTIGASNLTDAQKQQMATNWSIAFEDSIKELYAEKNVVLTQQAVVLGGTDYTAELKKEIAQKLEAKSGQK